MTTRREMAENEYCSTHAQLIEKARALLESIESLPAPEDASYGRMAEAKHLLSELYRIEEFVSEMVN